MVGTGDILLFSDEDIVYDAGYEQRILDEFEKHPEAEAIMFSLENTSDWNLGRLQTDQFRRATRRSVTASGVWGLVIKKDVLLKHNLHFNQYFGPGTDAYSGEDTIFLQDIIKGGIRMYMSPVVIASIDQSTSTWFDGFTDKYYIVKGMVLAAAYPKLAPVLAVRSVYRMTRKAGCERSFRELRKLYFQGIKQFHKR